MSSVRHTSQPRLLRLESLESRQILAADVELVRDFNPALTSKGHEPYYLTEINGVVYYLATDSTSGSELWRNDGTAAGTSLINDLNVGLASSGPAHLTNINGTLYFTANVGSFGRELWKSDGAAEGTVMVVNAVADSQIGLFNQKSRLPALSLPKLEQRSSSSLTLAHTDSNSGRPTARRLEPA
jgi:ELWxxDGT repeat protein